MAETGLPATRIDVVFEAGLWRTRWQVGSGELLALHAAPPSEPTTLTVDPAQLFAFRPPPR